MMTPIRPYSSDNSIASDFIAKFNHILGNDTFTGGFTTMPTIEEAQEIILTHMHPLSSELVTLCQALNRTIADDAISPLDIPTDDNSAMDGYAFRHSGLTNNRLTVSGFVQAGKVWPHSVPNGEAVKIMTGATLPVGCDTVVPVEDVDVHGSSLQMKGVIKCGSHVRKKGEDVRKGSVVIPSGTLLRHQEIGMLAAMGNAQVKTIRKPKVAILSTGDELLEPGSRIEPGKIYNSNSYSLAAQVMNAGGVPVMLGIAPDQKEVTIAKIQEGLLSDFLIITGGVSVGDCDFVKEAIEELRGELKFWKVDMKPGKPLAFAMIADTPVFALPGNPVAATVSFELFVLPALLKAMGHNRLFRPQMPAILKEEIRNKGNRPHLIRCQVTRSGNEFHAITTGDQGSHRLSSLTRGNCLLRVEPETVLPQSSAVNVTPLNSDVY